MSFVNKKVGNGFSMKAIDSSKDNEHYFGGSKKYINLNISTAPLHSASFRQNDVGQAIYDSVNKFTYISSSDFNFVLYFSGSLFFGENGAESHLTGSDKNKNILSNFYNYDSSVTRLVTETSFEFSCSYINPTEDSEVQFYSAAPALLAGNAYAPFMTSLQVYSDGTLDLLSPGTIEDVGSGWKRITRSFLPKAFGPFTLNLRTAAANSHFQFYLGYHSVTGAPATPSVVAFRSFQMKLIEAVSSEGIEYFKNLDNQNIEKESVYLNIDAFKKIE